MPFVDTSRYKYIHHKDMNHLDALLHKYHMQFYTSSPLHICFCSNFYNRAEKFFKEEIEKVLPEDIKLVKQKDTGYPDWKIEVTKKDKTVVNIACEVKATSEWKDNDSNRRVITSSSRRISNNFIAPIYHLMLTIIYDEQSLKINSLVMDFLETTTIVNVRYEASVSHCLLANATHSHHLIN